MRIRKTTSGKCWLIMFLLLLNSSTAYAYSAEELYKDCGQEYTTPYSEEDIDTISNYNFAKRYVSMYRYVSSSEYDETIINERIAACEETVSAIEEQLLNGYSLSESEIYQLESDYKVAKQQLDDAKNVQKPIDIDVKRLNAEEIPTYNQYVRAMNRKKTADINCNLGNNKIPVLTMQAYLVRDYTDTCVTITTVKGGGVCAMYNGVVAGVSEDHVTINHHNGIVSSYKGITPTVNVGDTVLQGSPVGTTLGEFQAKLKVDETLVNLYKLLEVSDENVQD